MPLACFTISGVDHAEIAALLTPYARLEDRTIASINIYLKLLLKWNAKMNLTSVRDPVEIMRRHFGESFFAAAHLSGPADSLTAIDLGSGAGFPGIPLALFSAEAQVTLIEANGRKSAFLNEVIRALELNNARVFNGRAEVFSGKANLVIMRAVEKFDLAVGLALKLVRPGGRLALMIGESQVKEARAQTPEVNWGGMVMVPGGRERVLMVGEFGTG
ncbi:MAG TPA: 16S rRNA (guanine(527)-N(7))-methyltransferase RsmG [Candidatus Saccharimonadales bacterium]|jgi:16S rRNA (guanine527-N7)-methyltransferase|nr:16S rRNA (guanine(527)-N(7))-methyltransferase RsmG [Candidatus Saccharimonadales bacterium]